LSDLFLIVGLGNPGSQYSQTRHNAGFWFLDRLHSAALAGGSAGAGFKQQAKLAAETCRVQVFNRHCVLAKPMVFMNNSGRPVRALLDYYKIDIENLLVAYDELDLPPGTARLKKGGGHGGHNGMRDIFRHVDNTDFLRLRIGIGHPGHKDAVTGYVLSRPTAAQERQMLQSISDAIDVMPDLLAGNVSKATKDLHTGDVSPVN